MNRRLGLAVLILALVAADLIRPSLPTGIPPFQVLLAAVFVSLVWRFCLRDLRAQSERWALLALCILAFALYLQHPRSLDADGIRYFAFARSLIADRDLVMANEEALLGFSGLNVLPIGAPLVWMLVLAPLYAIRSLAGLVFGFETNGTEPMFIAAACLVSIVLGVSGLFLLYRELRRHAAPFAALLAVLLVWFGSPLRFYMRVLPSFAHAIEFFASVLLVVTALRLRDEGDSRRALLAGLSCGLVYLVRSQDGLLLLVPAVFAIDAFAKHRRFDRLVREGALIAAGFASLAWIQSAVWWVMFDTPFLVPHKLIHGEAFAPTVGSPMLLEVFLSDRGGLFSTYPMTLAAVSGLVFLWRRDRAWVIAALAVLLLQWRLNASIFDWYQVRRFTGTMPLLAFGYLAVTPALARAGVLPCALLVLFVHQYDVAIDALRPLPGRSVPIREALRETGDSIAAPVYEGLLRVSPRVGVAFLEGYTGSTLLAQGRTELDLVSDDWWLRVPERARRFSAVEIEDGSLARFVDGREARLALALRGRGELRISFEIRSIETDTRQMFEVLANGTSLGSVPIVPSWQTVRFTIPEDLRREGTNEIVLRFSQTRHFFQLRGEGPRVYRAAALRRIILHGER